MPAKKPNDWKILAGTYRPSRDNHDAPEPEPGAPLAPEWLDEDGVTAWAELVAQLEPTRVLTKADRTALGLAADALSEYVSARQVVRKKGATYAKRSRGRAAMRRPVPEVAIATAARRDVFKMLEAFGLTPASRSRVAVDPKQKEKDENDEWDRIMGRR
jgi:P27 family predicted phage terminase small subunit